MSAKDAWERGRWVEMPGHRVADPGTGVEYDVLTGGVGNNTHVYFNRANFTGDGRFLIFRSDRTGNRIVGDDADYVPLLDVPTGTLTPLVRHNQELTIANTLYHPHPAFSPDGTRIVFCRRDAAGSNDVCLVQPANTEAVPWAFPTASCSATTPPTS